MTNDELIDFLFKIKDAGLIECMNKKATALSVFREMGIIIDCKIKELEKINEQHPRSVE